jgi:hypothetical protein
MLDSIETLATEDAPTPVVIDRIALDTEAQSNVEKQKPELVNTDNDAPNPPGMIARMVDNDDDEIQYGLTTKRVFNKDNTATDHEDASQAQEAQGVTIQSHQERNDQPQPDRAIESFDLPLLEATKVEEPSEVEVQPVSPIYDAIYVSDNHQLESQPYWKHHQKSLFVAVLLIICILLATMIGVTVSNGTQNSLDSRNPQQLAEPALDYGATTESVADPLDSADEENESKVVLANSSHTSLPHAVIIESTPHLGSTPAWTQDPRNG